MSDRSLRFLSRVWTGSLYWFLIPLSGALASGQEIVGFDAGFSDPTQQASENLEVAGLVLIQLGESPELPNKISEKISEEKAEETPDSNPTLDRRQVMALIYGINHQISRLWDRCEQYSGFDYYEALVKYLNVFNRLETKKQGVHRLWELSAEQLMILYQNDQQLLDDLEEAFARH